MNRDQLNEKARAAGVPDPEQFKTKGEVTQAIQAAELGAGQTQNPPHIVVIPAQEEGGGLTISVQAVGFSLVEVPTLLAIAKKQVEEKLGI